MKKQNFVGYKEFSTSGRTKRRNSSKRSPGKNRYNRGKARRNSNGEKNKLQNQYIAMLKRNKFDIQECRRIIECAVSKGAANGKVGKFYLNLLRNFPCNNSLKLDISSKYIYSLVGSESTCDSNTFYEWIMIQRNCGQIFDSEHLIETIKGLNIHRPSFKLLASMITTYCTFAIRSMKGNPIEAYRQSKNSRNVFDVMKDKYKYVPNTYLLNSLLNMYCKTNQSKLFWDLVVICDEIGLSYDAFTYGSLLEMCQKDENYLKMEDIYHCFQRNLYYFQDCDHKNIQYVHTLYNRMVEKRKNEEVGEYEDEEEEGEVEEFLFNRFSDGSGGRNNNVHRTSYDYYQKKRTMKDRIESEWDSFIMMLKKENQKKLEKLEEITNLNWSKKDSKKTKTISIVSSSPSKKRKYEDTFSPLEVILPTTCD